jgi:Esterase-like activity of phytase
MDGLRSSLPFIVCMLVCAAAPPARVEASKWSVSPLNSLVVDTSSVAVSEMSGVTYLGPSPSAGKYRFAAVQDSGGTVLTIDVEFSPSGSILSAEAIASLQLSQNLDFEGLSFTNPTRNSVFAAFENTPGVREYSLATGSLLQSVTIPSVFTNRVGNRGFESLARNPAGTLMWTGNEEALTVDGSLATASTGTIVRLLRMNVSGNTVTNSQQFAYEVEPIHTTGFSSQRRSGLSDLVLLPDDTLLALERSFDVSLTNPFYESRLYEVDFTGATDVSLFPLDAGLLGQNYTAIDTSHGKSLLWSGQAGGGTGQNLEGLTLGPRLASGDWILLGVIDDNNGADPASGNTLVSFLISANPSADFDENGEIDGSDFLAWQRGAGIGIGAQHTQGDADRDGDVDGNDLALWEGSFPALSTHGSQAVPESATAMLAFAAAVPLLSSRQLRSAKDKFCSSRC